jgi:thiol-disulfide isomerase/thioredoxin
MQIRKTLSIWLPLLAIFLVACGQVAPAQEAMPVAPPTEARMEKPAEMIETAAPQAMQDEGPEMADTATPQATMEEEEEMADSMPTEAAMGEPAMLAPAWFGVALADVRSGETFTVGDLKGKVVLVETMAQWCSTCFKQQLQVLELHQRLGEREDFASLGLDIDPNEDAATLKDYIEKNGFTWRYAVAPVEVAREIGQLYGDQFLNPPSAPMFVIDRQGEVHPLPFGVKSADALFQALEPFLNEEM